MSDPAQPPLDRRRFWWLMALAALCSLEMLAVQEYTALPSGMLPLDDMLKYMARRWLLDVSAWVVLVFLLRGAWLYAAFALEILAAGGLATYASYFGQPLSWFVLRNQWREGAAVADFALALIDWPAVALLAVLLVVKIAMARHAGRYPAVGLRRWRVSAIAATVYLVWAVALAGHVKPLTRLKFSSPEYAYGYAVAWIAEGAFFNEEKTLAMALEAAEHGSDRLAGREAPLEIGARLAIVQVESLDYDVVDAQVDGQWVMPFLHDLAGRSLFYAVEPIHDTGTSDADFTLLTGKMPNRRIAPYKVRGFPYRPTLPHLAREHGYASVALHGYTGSFFDRRPAYAQMGFAEIYFAEELEALGCTIVDSAVEDDDVLQLSARWMHKSRGPTLHFIVTFTSHGPFNRLEPRERELYPHPADKREAYLNSMRYVDRSLARYMAALPEATTLVVYGDHESGVKGYRPTAWEAEELVPWLVHTKGRDLAPRQATARGAAARSDRLELLDLATHLHKCMQQARVATQTPSDKAIHR